MGGWRKEEVKVLLVEIINKNVLKFEHHNFHNLSIFLVV